MDIELGEWIWKSVLIVLAGTVLLRVAGRKSISQMTLAQVVIMIGIGSLLIQPLAGENIWSTLYVGAMLVLTLVLIEFLQIKFDFFEKLVTGKSKILIEDGKIKEDNLQSVRLTVDQLETQLRQRNISKISDVKWATLEPNGQLGYMLKDTAKPSTKNDVETLRQEVNQLKKLLSNQTETTSALPPLTNQTSPDPNIMQKINQQLTLLHDKVNQLQKKSELDLFEEIQQQRHNNPPPEHLR
ncbi:DUF421 domain-containing protein [Alkalihalobacterium bogoriense]|uniref:DUF421 domain-containing protein n=1 Tax=Alkalihalobacterium bogoriense TaxID=246272 RepID=UPI0009FE3693|nr:DUF421 domain-containing protein [Alkalihalobacterium bogoriense]